MHRIKPELFQDLFKMMNVQLSGPLLHMVSLQPPSVHQRRWVVREVSSPSEGVAGTCVYHLPL